jgi:site-specific DNA-methyltransferase (adenine-specific)
MTAQASLFAPEPPVDILAGARWRIDQGDCIEWLRALPDASVDLITTDPAYESLEKHRAIGTTTRLKESAGSSNKWFEIFPNSRFPELFAEAFRVLRRDTHLYMHCDQETGFHVKPIAEAAGFRFWKALVWEKDRIGMGYHYRAKHEWVLFLEKGKRKLANLGIPDVLHFPRVDKKYPTEKPWELSKVFVEQSSLLGEIVVDMFAGSASAGEAALRAGRRFLGCDLSVDAVTLGRERLGAIA